MRTTDYKTAKKLGLVSAVGISVTVPSWFKGPMYERLVPPADLVKRYKAGRVTLAEYFAEYRVQLDALDAESVYWDIYDLVGTGRTPTLCCWCPPGEFCHRHLVASRFRSHGLNCYEINTEVASER